MNKRRERRPALVRRPDVDVSAVHVEEQLRHVLERRRPPRVNARAQTSSPREQHEISIIRVMVRVVMRDKDMPQRGKRYSRKHKLSRDAVSAIDDIGNAVADDDLSGPRTRRSWPRATARAQQNQSGRTRLSRNYAPAYGSRRCDRAREKSTSCHHRQRSFSCWTARILCWVTILNYSSGAGAKWCLAN